MAVLALCLLLLSKAGFCYLTALPPGITPRPNAYPIAALGEHGHGQQIWKRADTEFCDNQGIFHCPTGTCYEYQGLIGCCSVTSCAPRTTCIEYDPEIRGEPCNRDTGGCLYCNDPSAPYCRTQTNPSSSQYNHYCDTIGGTITVTTGPFAAIMTQAFVDAQDNEAAPPTLAKSTSISTMIVAASETSVATSSRDHSPSYGAIAGIACGVGAAVVAIAAALWYVRSRKRPRSEEEKEKIWTIPDTTPPSASRDEVDHASNGNEITEKNPTPPAPILRSSPDTTNRSIDDLGSPTSTLAYSGNDLKRYTGYTITNPDPNPTSPSKSSVRDFAASRISAVEAPSDRPVTTSRPSVSPNTSRDTSSSWTHSNSQFPSPITTHVPYTPSQYHPSAPDSIARPFLQPPSLPQDYSAATFASDATRAPAGSYTPSNYQPGAPESVARTAPPPNLPQDYSTATLSPDNPNGSPIYRGLRTSSLDAFPPYAYLSAEDALAGGWTNDTPPRGEH